MIDQKDIIKIAQLSRLHLDEKDIPKLSQQLSAILDYAATLDEISLDDVKPTAHAVEVSNIFRDDVPHQDSVAQTVLDQAPEAAPPFFRVPKVL